MPIFYSSAAPENISEFCDAWNETENEDVADVPTITLGDTVYFLNADDGLFYDGYFDPEYCLCCPLMREEEHVGYGFFSLNASIGLQMSSACIFVEKFTSDIRFGFFFPSPNSRQLRDPMNGRLYNINRWAGYILGSPPERTYGGFTDAEVCSALSSSSSAEIASLISQIIDPGLTQEQLAILEANWVNASVRDRLKLIHHLYHSAYFYQAGESDDIGTPKINFPLENYEFAHPKESQTDFDFANELDRLSATSTLNHLTFLTKFFAISKNRRKTLESALVEIGVREKLRIPYRTRDEVWFGSTANGQTVICSGAVEICDSLISFVNVIGGGQIGDVIYRDGTLFGTFDAQLWKARNHDGFIDPELQRGIGVSISM